jgi:hypothetical protein
MGCASKPPAHTVGGSVTFGGRPLLSGVIRFAPDDPQATPAAANVTDGRYTLTGVRPGKYTVTVEASAAVPVAGAETTSGTKAVVAPLPSIPPKYRTGVAVEVVADNPNLDFDLSK